MKPNPSTIEKAAPFMFRLQAGNMQALVLLLLSLIILSSKTAGILAVMMLGIILRVIILDSGYSTGSSKASKDTKKEANPQTQSPLFGKLPAELRIKLYRNLLVSKHRGRVSQPSYLVRENALKFRFKEGGNRANGLLGPGMDSTFLRCCRRIYEEALPVLYRDNIFMFREETELSAFRSNEITTKGTRNREFQIPIFNLARCHQGRLSMICRLELKFEGKYHYKGIDMRDWERFLLKESDVNQFEDIHFLGLEVLLLDFGDWKLNEDDKLVIHPFVYMFRGASGLKRLVVSGVKSEKNLERFKRALLEEGGEFFPGYPPTQGQINYL